MKSLLKKLSLLALCSLIVNVPLYTKSIPSTPGKPQSKPIDIKVINLLPGNYIAFNENVILAKQLDGVYQIKPIHKHLYVVSSEGVKVDGDAGQIGHVFKDFKGFDGGTWDIATNQISNN